MSEIDGLLNQSATLYVVAGKDRYARETYGAPSTIAVRFQRVNKVRMLPNGQSHVIDAIVFAKGSESIAINDRIDYGTDKYKVTAKKTVVGELGNTDHLELELIRWKETA